MRTLSRINCNVAGCTNEANVMDAGNPLCNRHYKEEQDIINSCKPPHTPTYATAAINYIKCTLDLRMPMVQPTTESRALARLAYMLYPYDSKVQTILSALHDLGYTTIEESHVTEVLEFLKTRLPQA